MATAHERLMDSYLDSFDGWEAVGWLGPRSFVQRMGFRMRSMAFADDTLRTEGEVSEVRSEETANVIVVQQRLTSGERLIAEATTEIRLSQ